MGRNWLNTGGRQLDLEALRGKIVLLDFWTFCCINCLHVLDELRPLEEEYRDVLVTVGVHSPKFEHEADPDALAAAVERYEIEHPVLDDPELQTWQPTRPAPGPPWWCWIPRLYRRPPLRGRARGRAALPGHRTGCRA